MRPDLGQRMMPGTPCFIAEEIGACKREVCVLGNCDSGESRPAPLGVQTFALPSGTSCGPTTEGLLPADSWNVLYDLQLERARFEAGEALNTLRRLQRRVSELEEESRLQDAEISGASLQTELAHSLDSDQDQDQQVSEWGGSQVSLQTTSPTFK